MEHVQVEALLLRPHLRVAVCPVRRGLYADDRPPHLPQDRLINTSCEMKTGVLMRETWNWPATPERSVLVCETGRCVRLRPARPGRARLGMAVEPLHFVGQNMSWNTSSKLSGARSRRVRKGRSEMSAGRTRHAARHEWGHAPPEPYPDPLAEPNPNCIWLVKDIMAPILL